MADSGTSRKIIIVTMMGLAATLLVGFGLLSSNPRVEAARLNGSEGTATPWPTPRATRTPCNICTPLPTWTPWWTPYTTCVPGVDCGTPRLTRTPCSACTPPPIASGTATPPARPILQIRPFVQFGHPDADDMAHYNQRLLNHFPSDTPIDLAGVSESHWPLIVRPEHLIVRPNIAATISITVGVPPSRTFPIDVEQIIATGRDTLTHPITATAYLITIAQRRPFTDVSEDHWADDPIQYLAAQGIVSGYSDGSFHPDDNVTRAQFAKMLAGAMGWKTTIPARPSFTDVSPSFWAYAYIETAAAHGVISGYSDGAFRPSAGVTRAQIAKMIVAARAWPMDDVSPESSFTDISAEDWLYNYAQTVGRAEVMSGYSDGTFRPYSYATRAQIARILTLSLYSDPNK